MTDPDTAFRELVRLMRAKQKQYFRTHDRALLNHCRDMERRVDEALKGPKPPGLFDEPREPE